MIAIRVVFLFLFVAHVLGSGFQDDWNQDANLEELLERLLDARDAKRFQEDDLVGRQAGVPESAAIDPEIPIIYNDMKNDHKYPWAIFKIEQNCVVVDTLGTGGYEEFIAALTASGEPRYALYDVPQDWVYAEFNIVFIFWIPDDVPGSNAVPYGRAVVGLKQKLAGIKTIMEAYGTASSIKDDMIYTVNKWYVGK